VELLSGQKIRPKAKDALNRASHHVKRISRQMNESTRSMSKRYVPRDVQYLDINSTTDTFDVVVVGCGPSGLTSALFASRMGMSVLVLGSPASGSLSGTDSLDNFPSYVAALGGKGWLELTIDQAIGFGAKFAKPNILATGLSKTDNGFQLSLSHSAKVNSRTVIIASGSNPRKLNLQHEEELWGRSVHNCALCDGDAYTSRNTAGGDGKTVVVIGGGDAAVEAVSLLARIGVHTIHWIHRRESFRANAAEVERVKALPNVQLWTSFVVSEWIVKDGADGKKVLDGVKIVGSKDGVADPEANSSLTIPCNGAFLMIGSTPNTKWLESSGMEMNDLGLIRLQYNEDVYLSTQTTIPGVFAAGEAIDGKYRQALTAASDGAKSAMDAERYLRLSATPIVPVVGERVPEPRRNDRAASPKLYLITL
jgi:thioredoxin reductase (NADPH)